MNFRVIGWTYYDDGRYPAREELSESAYRAIVSEIRKRGYRFGGDSHHFRRGCTPVLNDGTRVCFSQRAWGALMAEAWGIEDPTGYAYMVWYVEGRYDEAKNPVYPRPGVRRKFILPPEALVSVHEMHLADEPFFAIRNGSKTVEIRLCDEKRKVIDNGDVIVFERGNTGEKVVTRVTEQWECESFLEAYELFPPMRFGGGRRYAQGTCRAHFALLHEGRGKGVRRTRHRAYACRRRRLRKIPTGKRGETLAIIRGICYNRSNEKTRKKERL